ncbi:hypothetical protein HOA92_04700 [archaeon]|jgi:hypothetical protein|nr:hypothetical protein [archaeon]MBT6762316.1 hypothetical protein [archaeon]
MASALDLGLLQYFAVIFPTLLVFVLVYAILGKFKLLGESTAINSIVAICCAILVSLSEGVVSLIVFMAPWFVFVFILILLFLLIMKTFGTTDADILNVVTRDAAVTWTILGIVIIIVVAGFTFTFGQDILDQSQSVDDGTGNGEDIENNIFQVIFHPKILGVLVLFGISVMAIGLLTGKT